MPTLVALALILLLMTPPIYGILVILIDIQTPPRQRTTRAVGGALLFKSLGLASLMLISLAAQSQLIYLLPVGLVSMTVLAVTRIMQLEFQGGFELRG